MRSLLKQARYAAFKDTPVDTLRPNWRVLCIAPDGGIALQFEVKRQGPAVDLDAVTIDFHSDDWFPKTVIYDVLVGDPTLFMRADMVEQGWAIVQPVLDAWAEKKADFPDYDSGSNGPKAADELLARRESGLGPVSRLSGRSRELGHAERRRRSEAQGVRPIFPNRNVTGKRKPRACAIG